MAEKYLWTDWDWPEGDSPGDLYGFFQLMNDQMEKFYGEEYERITKRLTQRFEAAADLVVNDIAENCRLVRDDGMLKLIWLTEPESKVLIEWHDDEPKQDRNLREKGCSVADYEKWGM